MGWRKASKGQRERRRAELLERTAEGEPLTRITRDDVMPARSTVYEWLDKDPAFATAFRIARGRGVHALADQCLEIADEPVATAVEVSNKKLRIDTRLRLMAKWLPTDHGERVTSDPSGPARIDVSTLTDEQLAVLASIPIL